jgi:hypothetical protein
MPVGSSGRSRSTPAASKRKKSIAPQIGSTAVIRETVQEYVKARDKVLLNGKLEDLREFLKERNMPCPKRKDVLTVVWHQCITASENLPKDYRRISRKWLIDKGYRSLDNGDLEDRFFT